MNSSIVETGMETFGFVFNFFNWYGYKHPSPLKLKSNAEVILGILLLEKGINPPNDIPKFVSDLLAFLKKEGFIYKEENAKLSAKKELMDLGDKVRDLLGNNSLFIESLPKDSNLYGYLSGVNRDTYTKVFYSKITEEYLSEVRRVVFKQGIKYFREIEPSDVDDFINDFIVKTLDRDLLKSAILNFGSIPSKVFGYWCVRYATNKSRFHRKHRTQECVNIEDIISSSCFHNPVKDYENKQAIIKFLEILEEETDHMKDHERNYIRDLIRMRYLGNSSNEIKENIPSAWYWADKIKSIEGINKSDYLD